jgi:23S rRNA (cytidine1920-2'-O)/16S rRNA (cytidine1409-2'-O)-methyltransferase
MTMRPARYRSTANAPRQVICASLVAEEPTIVRRRLDAELVRRGLTASRQRALEVIEAGRVLVGGMPARSASRRVAADEPINVSGEGPRFVSRGGEKLAAALHRFDVSVTGRRALDAGASTGGFTDCLLQAGAEHVVAVDVGRGQLAWSLRTDPRVTVLERTNVRHLEQDAIGGPAELCTADLSFISLSVCAPALARCTTAAADLMLLVKPQFEAERADVGKGGVVRDPSVHRAVLRRVREDIARAGVHPGAVMPSPLRGPDGNVEFFFHCRKDVIWRLGDDALDAAVESAHAGVRGRP